MAANGGGDFHDVDDAGVDLQEAQEVARRAMSTPNRGISDEGEMPLSTDAADATANKSDFSFTPPGPAAGSRVPTLKFSGTPDGENERLPSAAATTGSINRPASAEALEYMSATSDSMPLLETASAEPDTLAAGGSAAAGAVPSAAAPPATAAEEPATADGSAAAADDGVTQAIAKAQRLVPKLPSVPARQPQDAFVGLPDDVLHGGGGQPTADASSTLAEAATSIQEESAAPLQGAGSAAEAQGPAGDAHAAASSQSAEAAGANSPTAPLRTGSRSQMLAQRQEQEWGGRSLQELQRPHKSRLLREQEEWAERSGTKPVSARKQIAHTRHVKSPGEKADAPSFMKDTMASTMKHIDIPEPPRTPGSA